MRWSTRHALREVSLEIGSGERVALLGPSGGGKSTLMRLMQGALQPSAGRVLVDGIDLSIADRRTLRRHRCRCAFVEQGNVLVPQASVHHNVVAGLARRWPWHKVVLALLWPVSRTAVAEQLRHVGLSERQWDLLASLSGGQQQRVAIARALIAPAGQSADCILADEPTASLDPETARGIMELLLGASTSTSASHRSTLVFCTHWASAVLPHVDRVIGLRDGEIALDAPAQDVDATTLESLYAGSTECR